MELTGSSLLYICWLHICLKETRSNCFGVLAAMLRFLHPKKFSFHSFRSRPVKATICLLSKGLLISHILLKTYSQVLRVKIIKLFERLFSCAQGFQDLLVVHLKLVNKSCLKRHGQERERYNYIQKCGVFSFS